MITDSVVYLQQFENEHFWICVYPNLEYEQKQINNEILHSY